MADIFISYATEDRSRASILAALLEAQGYSVWWDTKLLSGDKFRKQIMIELGKARAVLVIWTRNAVNSDWVQSEAGRAHANGNLIPVKEAGLDYAEIPFPFDNMHIENVDDHDKVVAAVVAQLARPQSMAPSVTRLSRALRYQILSWAGAAGGALTLFTNLGSVLKLSEWAQWVVAHWIDWINRFWMWVSLLVPIHLPKRLELTTTFMAFVFIAAVGSHATHRWANGDRSQPIFKFQYVIGWHTLAAAAWFQLFSMAAQKLWRFLFSRGIDPFSKTYWIYWIAADFILPLGFAYLLLWRWPRPQAIKTSFAIAIISCLFFESASVRDDAYNVPADDLWSNIPLVILAIGCVLVASPQLMHRRLWLILGFLVLLVVGNEIAKFELQL